MGYRVCQTVGLTMPALRSLNPLLRRRNAAMLEAWLLHNVQEVGNLPQVLPELYARYAP
jgi:hypothetical protein